MSRLDENLVNLVNLVNLNVVLDLVSHVATVGRGHHEQLATTYASTQSQAWDAEHGWVGRSASALSALLERWQSHAADHHRLLNDHHDGLDFAATTFVEMDRAHAERLRHVYDADVG